MVKLDPLKLGDASDLVVTGSGNKVKFSDVLVGEVWIGSGQSNMAGGAGGYAKNDEVLAKAITAGPYPTLRLYNRGTWAVADENPIKGFSRITSRTQSSRRTDVRGGGRNAIGTLAE